MADMWKAITKDGKAPSQNARKILFWTHPKDQAVWFPKIARDFWTLEGYEFAFFCTEAEVDNVELTDFSYRVDCMVILVTKRLLEDGKLLEAMLGKIKEAGKIPIFPISTLGREDESTYERYFGQIHFVRYGEPNTYIHALAGYVHAACLDSKTVSEIRGAFKSQAFISYRKKDHALLEQLMRRIQEDERCSGLALWHDEFLIPGENYSQEIEEAIQGCKVFLLVVTPHLLEQPNYVADVEYPEAGKLQKVVVPVGMANVDEDELKTMYPGISDCVRLDDEDSWEQMIKKLVAESSPETNADEKDGAVHSYLMGLAYLNGILVAIDAGKAEELLMQSADAGSIRAMEMLGTKYVQGVLHTDSEERLWKIFDYQLTAVEELLKQRKTLSVEEASHVVRRPVIAMLQNAKFLFDLCVGSKEQLGALPLGTLAAYCRRAEELRAAILSYRDYLNPNDDFGEKLYTRFNAVVGYEKFYSKEEKRWKAGKEIRKVSWREVGVDYDKTLPLSFARLSEKCAVMYEQMAQKTEAIHSEKSHESAELFRLAAVERKKQSEELMKRISVSAARRKAEKEMAGEE